MTRNHSLAMAPLLVLSGCGTNVGSTPTGIEPGIYSGLSLCQWVETELGVEFPDSSALTISRVFSDNGLPLAEGQEVAVGITSTETLGNLEIVSTVTVVNPSANGLQILFDATAIFDCGNTCQFAGDGVCDEVNFCPLATDCFDCGPVTLTGFGVVSYQTLSSGAVRRTVSSNLREEDAGLVSIVSECTATLSK